MSEGDISGLLQAQVRDARATARPLCIQGSGSKAFLGPTLEHEALSVHEHSGIIDYHPGELVLRARGGTPLARIEAQLREQGQMLPCEPPAFGPGATLGGVVASGLSGPRRPYVGSIGDMVLGCRIINGDAEVLNFGGMVMKNVAGYDLSRLMVGAHGCLGVLLDITLKVLPAPRHESSLRLPTGQQSMASQVQRVLAAGLPVSASSHDGSALHLRFSFTREPVRDISQVVSRVLDLEGKVERLEQDYWHRLREHSLDFFSMEPGYSLWRISLPASAAPLPLAGPSLWEWQGALRWHRSNSPAAEVFAAAAAAGGHATLFRPGQSVMVGTHWRQPLAPELLHWHRRLKQAFDPVGIFNPGKLGDCV